MLGDIINGKYAKLLLKLRKDGAKLAQLSKEVDINLSALSVQISRFSIQGLITKAKQGREVVVVLTEYGKAQAELISQILKNIKERKESEAKKDQKEVNDEKAKQG